MRPAAAALLATTLAAVSVLSVAAFSGSVPADAQSAPSTMPAASPGTPGAPGGPQQAGGNTNQAVATTAANAAKPAHGANSFTRAQATRRLLRGGFRDVHDLIRDDNGVWHGGATRNGAPVQVWEDYKGNVGTE
ncbi:MAG: hypothetical protein INR65_10180 [Gluconacetobacter diazotrophicus]|nr:hypothetical protein [Gluconacetobacter diazotrophicus]